VNRSSKPPLCLPRLRVRSLVILVLLLGGGFGWTVNTVHRGRMQRAAVAAIETAGGVVFYDWETRPNPVPVIARPVYRKYRARNPDVSSLKRPHWDGIDYISNVVEIMVPDRLSDDELALVGRFPRLEKIWCPGTSIWVSDAGLAHLNGLSRLKELDLSKTRITDSGLVELRGLKGLLELNLARTRITDAGLAHLSGLSTLRALDLRGTDVSNAGIIYLKELTGLRTLNVEGTDVDRLGAQELKCALPDVTVLVTRTPATEP
jgi:Leucine-rich repeat (LRR) protein